MLLGIRKTTIGGNIGLELIGQLEPLEVQHALLRLRDGSIASRDDRVPVGLELAHLVVPEPLDLDQVRDVVYRPELLVRFVVHMDHPKELATSRDNTVALPGGHKRIDLSGKFTMHDADDRIRQLDVQLGKLLGVLELVACRVRLVDLEDPLQDRVGTLGGVRAEGRSDLVGPRFILRWTRILRKLELAFALASARIAALSERLQVGDELGEVLLEPTNVVLCVCSDALIISRRTGRSR